MARGAKYGNKNAAGKHRNDGRVRSSVAAHAIVGGLIGTTLSPGIGTAAGVGLGALDGYVTAKLYNMRKSRMSATQASAGAKRLAALQKKHNGDMSKAVAEYNRKR